MSVVVRIIGTFLALAFLGCEAPLGTAPAQKNRVVVIAPPGVSPKRADGKLDDATCELACSPQAANVVAPPTIYNARVSRCVAATLRQQQREVPVVICDLRTPSQMVRGPRYCLGCGFD